MPVFAWEAEVLRALEGVRSAVLDPLFEAITMLGEETLLVVVLAVLYFAVDKGVARRLFFITMTSMSVNGIVKNLARVPRPFTAGVVSCVRPDTATGFSFPSGHTQNFATWSTVVAQLLRRVWVWIVAAVLIALVALSRMYLGAHYPTDVLVGAGLGILLAIVGNALYDRVENKTRLYLVTVLALTPFAVVFWLIGDPLYEDYFKFYGMLVGFAAAIPFEERFAPLDLQVAGWKKAIRVAAVIAVVLLVKLVFDSLDTPVVWLSLLKDAARSVVMIFAAMGVCPWIFKHVHI